MERFRRFAVVAAALALSAGPFAASARAYHCYSDVVGDCSAVQHFLEDFKQNYKQHLCTVLETATLGIHDC